MLNKILKAAREGTLIIKAKAKIHNELRECCRTFIVKHYNWLPINRNKIVFDNFGGRGFGDHPRYIAEEIHRRGLNWDVVWLVSDMNTPTPEWVRKVRFGSVRSLYECATAKMWVDNIRNAHLLPKRKGQVYLQTWHGAGLFGFKKVEADAEKELSHAYVAAAKYDGMIIDGILSQCKRYSEVYQNAFWLGKGAEILEFGGPRSDCLFDNAYITKTRIDLRKKLNVAENDFVVLYAPTFRDSGDCSAYNLDFQAIQIAFERKTGKNCRIMIRLHPNVPSYCVDSLLKDTMLNGRLIPDANDALIASDAVISDFSGIVYEATLLKKLSFLCALDYDLYVKGRPIYPDSVNYPFLFVHDIGSLVRIIEETDFDVYWRKITAYIQAYPTFDDGFASKRVVDWFLKKQRA